MTHFTIGKSFETCPNVEDLQNWRLTKPVEIKHTFGWACALHGSTVRWAKPVLAHTRPIVLLSGKSATACTAVVFCMEMAVVPLDSGLPVNIIGYTR